MTQVQTSHRPGHGPGGSGPAANGANGTGSGRPAKPDAVSGQAWFTLGISSCAAFMVAMEVTVIALALPRIQGAFPGTTSSTLSWVFSAYSIGVASLLLVAGWAADLYGRKRLFLIGMTIFALGSLLSGTAQSMAWLIGARALQSLGGAMLFPSGLALVLAIFPPTKRQLAIGIWAATGGLAGAIGPSGGALLIELLGWRAVFLFNVPVAAIAIPLGLWGLIESKAEGVPRRVDVIGVPLASLGVGALVLAIVEGGDWGWSSTRIVGLLVLSVLFVAGFIVRSLRHPAPLFDLALFKIRSYRIGLLGSLLFSAGFFGSWVLLPTFVQAYWKWGVVKTGLAFMPASLISAILSGPIGSRVDRFGHRRVVALGALLAASGMASFALFMKAAPRILLAVVLPSVLLGLGMAVLFAMLVGAAMRDVPMARYGSAGAGRTTVFQMGQALGVAIGVAVIGTPATAAAALNSYRHNWIISASVLAAIVVLFLVAYPSHRVAVPAVAPPGPTVDRSTGPPPVKAELLRPRSEPALVGVGGGGAPSIGPDAIWTQTRPAALYRPVPPTPAAVRPRPAVSYGQLGRLGEVAAPVAGSGHSGPDPKPSWLRWSLVALGGSAGVMVLGLLSRLLVRRGRPA